MKIGHYMPGMQHPGGVASYIRRISEGQRAAGHEVMLLEMPDEADLLRQAEAAHLDLLHLHTRLHVPPPPELRVARTLHGHWPYCPSGSRYLRRPAVPCPRKYSLPGCLW